RQFVPVHAGLDLEDSKISVNVSDSRRPQGRGRGGSNPSFGRKKYCTYCGKDNHIVDNCYKKHGFSPNFGRNAAANHANAEEQLDNDDVRSTKGTESFTITKSQYEKLVNLLQSTPAPQSAGPSTQVNGASTSNLASTSMHNPS
ncbi:integrase catalytic region, partial [Trifolium medium]|nr:integrase catalytic region [Trifolium medium]